MNISIDDSLESDFKSITFLIYFTYHKSFWLSLSKINLQNKPNQTKENYKLTC